MPLGPDAQVIVFDSSAARNAVLDMTKPVDAQTFSVYERQARVLGDLTSNRTASLFVSHHPVLAFARSTAATIFNGNPALQAALLSLNGDSYFPAGVQAALHGHVHLFQAITFSSAHPATIVAGNGGDELDRAFPEPFPKTRTPLRIVKSQVWVSRNRVPVRRPGLSRMHEKGQSPLHAAVATLHAFLATSSRASRAWPSWRRSQRNHHPGPHFRAHPR